MNHKKRSDCHLSIKMTNFEKAAIAFLSVLAIGLIGAAIWIYQVKWRQPLGPALQMPTVTLMWTSPTQTSISYATTRPVSISPTFSAPVTSTNTTGQCGAPSLMNILAIGSDQRGDEYKYGLADAIRLIRIDTVTPRVTVLEFPRDLWVEIPDIADNLNGQDHEKLNQAYLYGNRGFGYTDDPAQGPGLLARTLALNFGTRIDHYAAVNMRTFVKIVDTLGGIDIDLPYTIDGRVRDSRDANRYFAAGEHDLNGYRTMLLARLRPEGDFQRVQVQNLIMRALAERLISRSSIAKLPDLIETFKESVQTDLGPVQVAQLLCLKAALDPQKIEFVTFPESLFDGQRIRDPVLGRTSILAADFEVLADYVEKFRDGSWREPEEDPREEINP